MKIDFWNNPIVVSAMRVKYRQSNPFVALTLYAVVLAFAAAILYHSASLRLGSSFPLTFFILLMVGQTFISSLNAAISVSKSLKAELTTYTLDVQRIATLSPRQIILGKLLGESAVAAAMAVVSIPFAVLCWSLGVVPFVALVLVYVNMATTVLLMGAASMRKQLVLPDGITHGTGSAGCLTTVVWFTLWILLSSYSYNFDNLFSVNGAAVVLGLLTPASGLYGIAKDNPYFSLLLFGFPIPYLVFTPLCQLFVTFWCFKTMERQFIHPLNPPAGKGMCYLTLLGADVLLAGFLFDLGPWTLPLGPRGAVFCLAHLLLGLVFISEATPWQATLQSWVWRFRQAKDNRHDPWLGDRSPNGPMVLTFCLIGIVSVVLFVILPGFWADPTISLHDTLWTIAQAASLSTVLLLTIGTLLQFVPLMFGSGSAVLTAILGTILIVTPLALGTYAQEDWITNLSAAVPFLAWVTEKPFPIASLVAIEAVYLVLTVSVWAMLNRRLRIMVKQVDGKLRQMGVAR